MFSSVIALLASITVMVSSLFVDASSHQWGRFFNEQQTDQPQREDVPSRPVRPGN